MSTLAQFSVTRRQAPGLLFYKVTAEETVDVAGMAFPDRESLLLVNL